MSTKTIKVADATNTQLDWLVAKCEDLPLRLDPLEFRREYPATPQSGWWVWYGTPASAIVGYTPARRGDHNGYTPTTNPAQMWPIIEREEIGTRRNVPCSKGREWEASPSPTAKGAGGAWGYGPTSLIAAARCYVASKLGEVAEVPEDLT